MALGLDRAFPNRAFEVPAGFQQVAEINLAGNPLTAQNVYHLSLQTNTRVGLFILLNDIKGAPVHIGLVAQNGEETVFLNMSDPKTSIGKGSSAPNLDLQPGEYDLRATLPECQGTLRLYVRLAAPVE
jgi:hypothetical protein